MAEEKYRHIFQALTKYRYWNHVREVVSKAYEESLKCDIIIV